MLKYAYEIFDSERNSGNGGADVAGTLSNNTCIIGCIDTRLMPGKQYTKCREQEKQTTRDLMFGELLKDPKNVFIPG